MNDPGTFEMVQNLMAEMELMAHDALDIPFPLNLQFSIMDKNSNIFCKVL